MKLITVLSGAMALTMLAGSGYAQIVNVKDVAKEDATHRANNNIENGVDNTMGKAEGAIKGLFKKKKKTADTPPPAPQPQPAPQQQMAAPAPVQDSPGFRAYNNYDFVPGDKLIFADDFADDQVGEFPAHWNLGSGQAVINMVGGRKALLITDGNYGHVAPLIKSASYLTDPFTIEYDAYSTGSYPPNIYFYASNADAVGARNDLAKVTIGSGESEGTAHVSTGGDNGVSLSGNFPADINGANYMNKWHHVALAFKKNQLKIYVDQYRVLVVPNLGLTPHAIDIEGIGDAQNPIIIANLRIANGGGMNMLGKKFTDAKIITHGINFDVDKSTIKPESMGTLNMIVGVMKDNPDLKFEVDGHTDNSGTPAHNMQLSQQRSQAVMGQLITMGIDASRLSTKGFGDTKPMADNFTPEGKANNRRVEFVKM